MILSHKHKFILLSCPKTASTSTHAIVDDSGILGPEDVYTGYKEGVLGATPLLSSPRNLPNISFETMCNDVIDVPYASLPFRGESTPETDLSSKLKKSMSDEQWKKMNMDTIWKNMSVSEIVKSGMVSDTSEYEKFFFVRDPIQRYLSAFFFLTASMGKTVVYDDVLYDIDSIQVYDDIIIFCNRPYTHYLEEGVQALLFENYKQEIENIVRRYGGEVKEPLPRFKSDSRPEWSKKPIDHWLPKKHIDKLKTILKDDIEVYNSLIR